MTKPAGGVIQEAIRGGAKEKGLTQKALAERVGITEKHLSQILTGRVQLSLRLTQRLAAAVGLALVLDPVDGRAELKEALMSGEIPTTYWAQVPECFQPERWRNIETRLNQGHEVTLMNHDLMPVGVILPTGRYTQLTRAREEPLAGNVVLPPHWHDPDTGEVRTG